MSAVQAVLDQLSGVQKNGSGWTARCPVRTHGKGRGDVEPSLSVSEGDDGRVLVKCHAGCSYADVMAALSHGNGHGNGKTGPGQSWGIRGPSGEMVAVHHRKDLPDGTKKVWWTLPDGSKGLNGTRTSELPFYGSEKATRWPSDVPVVIVEGEKSADALASLYPACVGTVTGAGGTPSKESLEVLRGRSVVLWPDADGPGKAHMERIAKALQGVASAVRIFQWTDAPEGGDAADHQIVKKGLPAARSEIEGLIGAWSESPLFEHGAEAERTGEPNLSPTPWPELNDKALLGLAGEVVSTILPHTEADAAALLVNFLVGFGNAAGRGAHVKVGAARHGLNLFAVLVGETSKARKGSSWGFIKDLLHAADPFWAEDRVMGGLSSGEGLIFHVRDSVTGVDKEGGLVVRDEGAPDKRLLALETEFGGPLKVATREGNTLSVLIRQSWDGGKLATLTRNSPLKSSDPHVSIIGHVTRAELLNSLSETDTMGGLSNRFLWCMVRRSKLLPFGGGWGKVDVAPLMRRLSEALDFAREIGELRWGGTARDLWGSVYAELSEGKPGLLGAATSRAEAQVLRLATLYAVLDLSSSIEAEHLEAALAVWRYAESSALVIFGDATGNPIADRIAAALEEKPDGMSRTEVRDLFKRHQSKARLDGALALLEKSGKARRETAETTGRPSERWFSR